MNMRMIYEQQPIGRSAGAGGMSFVVEVTRRRVGVRIAHVRSYGQTVSGGHMSLFYGQTVIGDVIA